MWIGREKEQTRENERDKERKKRGNRRYGQAKFKHSRKGILSCVIAAIAALILIILIVISYMYRGSLDPMAGSFGLYAALLSWIGIGAGGKGFRERDKNYLTCKIGIVINVLIFLCLTTIFIRGCV